MKINYKVVEEHPAENQIVVRFWTDKLSEHDLASNPHAEFITYDENGKEKKNLVDFFEDGKPRYCRTDMVIDVPVPEPTPKELEKMIIRSAQYHWLKRLEQIKDDKIDTTMKCHKKLMKGGSVTEEEYKAIADPVHFDVDEEELKKLLEDLK